MLCGVVTNYKKIRTMTAHLINSLISVSLKTAMCYLHCTKNLAESDLDGNTFIIKPEPEVVCQAQCWQNWDQTKQLQMFGLKELMREENDWGTDAESFLTQSYKHWQWSRYDADLLFPTVNQLRYNESSNSTSGAAVPVCYSPQPIKSYNKLKNEDKALPCICGDEMGNETRLFFYETNFQSWAAADGGKHRFGLGADALCDQTKDEVREILWIGGSNLEVNCHLCWQSDVGKRIKEDQRRYVHHDHSDHRNHYNFKQACEKQMGKKEVCNL